MNDRTMLTPTFLDMARKGFESLVQSGWTINEPALPVGRPQERMVALYEPLAAFVAETVLAGDRPISVAGDCCTTIGVLAGLQRAGLDPTLLWLDAHGDFNTWETTPSGFLGGMPLAMLAGRGEQTIVEGVGLRPLPEGQIVLADGRDLDPPEAELLAESAVRLVEDPAALADYDWGERPLYVHFDVDIIDPADAPAMSYPAPGGPAVATLERAFRAIAATGQVRAISFSAWNPALDEDGRSRDVCLRLLQTLIGAR